MSTFQQKALVPFYLPVNFAVTTTPTDFDIAASVAAFAPYAKSYLAGAVPKAFQATLHSIVLFCVEQVTAASVSVAITTSDETALMPAATAPFIVKSSAAGSGTCVAIGPVTTIWILNPTTGEMSIRLATNAGTLTVEAIVMVFEFHAP